MTTQPEFPRVTNSLLSQEEKTFLDDLPDGGVAHIFSNSDMDLKLTFIAKDFSITKYYEFRGEKAQAVRDYYEMLFAYGVRKDPRADAA